MPVAVKKDVKGVASAKVVDAQAASPKAKTTFNAPAAAAAAKAPAGKATPTKTTPAKTTTTKGVTLSKSAAPPAAAPAAKKDAATLHTAAAAGSPGLKKLVDAAVPGDLECVSGGDTPLLAAARAGQLEAVTVLADAGAQLRAKDASGATSLLLLIRGGHASAAAELVSHAGADSWVDAADSTGETALAVATAATAPDLPLISAILKAGASPDFTVGAHNDTLLMRSIHGKQAGVVDLLLPSTKDVNAVNAKGETALSLALSTGDEPLILCVLAAGPTLGGEGVRMTKAALDKKQDGLAAALLRLIPPTNAASLDLDPRSLICAGMSHTAFVNVAIANAGKGGGAGHNIDSDGNTLLHLAAAEAPAALMYKVVSALLSLGVPPDAANKSDVNTALHVAAKTGSVEACRALLDGGADPTKRNGKNRTPCSQPKIPESTKDFLLDKEEAFRKRKEEAKADMYGGKLAETQTQSAFGLRCL